MTTTNNAATETATVRIRDLTSGDVHTLPATTRCLDEYGRENTIASLDIGELAAVESDMPDHEGDRDHPDGTAVREGHIWWASERIG